MSGQTFLAALESRIEDAVVLAENEIKALAAEIGPIIVHYAEDFLQQVAQIALRAVLAEVPKAIDGSEKFGAAVTHVIQQIEADGKAIAVQDAQLAVQATYEKVKAAAQQVL